MDNFLINRFIMVNKKSSPTKKEIEKVVEKYNEQEICVDISAFNKVRDIIKYQAVLDSLKKEARGNFNFDMTSFHRVFLLEDKICALKYHLSNINKLKQKHKKALINFANLFSTSSSDQRGSSHVIHSGVR